MISLYASLLLARERRSILATRKYEGRARTSSKGQEIPDGRDPNLIMLTHNKHSPVASPTSLSPLPAVVDYSLIVNSCVALLSFALSFSLLSSICWRLWKGRSEKLHHNQFLVLIANLLSADVTQSLAFLLNIQWVAGNSIDVSSHTCWAQGWFVSTGDLASGVFTLLIACHAFADIVFDYHPSQRILYNTIWCCWTFVYLVTILGVATHGSDFYTRAGAWCWINTKYANERLYLHYLWIIIAEFGTVVLYTIMYFRIRYRIKNDFYGSGSTTAARARRAAHSLVWYPIVYVVCTLPLAVTRIASMAGREVTFLQLTVAASMITSNGWLDVLLYSVTRHAMLFSHSSSKRPCEVRAVDTFAWSPDSSYGTTTTIEAVAQPTSMTASKRPGFGRFNSFFSQQNASTEELVEGGSKKQRTSISVVKETQVRIDSISVPSEAGNKALKSLDADRKSDTSFNKEDML